jgi:hypothetical protein
MKHDKRVTDIVANQGQREQKKSLPISQIRFSQNSLGSGFSSPPPATKNVPLAVSLRSANPLSVLTELPGQRSAIMVRNEDDPHAFTTFDHRRLVNSALHQPEAPVVGRITDKADIPTREWGKDTTRTRGESINIVAPSGLNLQDERRNLGSLSVLHGPDAKLQDNIRKALSHMIRRESVLAELTGKAGNTHDNTRHENRKEEYNTRLADFDKRYLGK